ncbi:adenosine kinase [Oceanomicrobium pacificus]|uniref:Adenosine kinase n=1 Tax=Oceanomicrobium pacificus TaxID=2692916 RepID=A0A6B0TUJ7_9RHOB|nr:adenosine kinase [Oceanomicrobium pacificus]MXU66469.1 adenosine kinase [Oceanomicrobium pacificus]
MTKSLDVVGIGNAMIDVLAHVEEDVLDASGVEKGIMQLIDRKRAVDIYSVMGPAREVSGGSAANTIATLAGLGARTSYVGKIKDDQLGEIFAHDIRAQGARFDTPLAPRDHDADTGRCLVLVTPDGERSMNTYLGVSEFLSPADIDTDQMADANWLYLEGYRFDGPDSHAAFAKAIAACKSAGGRVSITLSDPFCVERHRDAFREMVQRDVDLLFANEHELRALYQTDDLSIAMTMAAAEVDLVACTAGAEGAYIAQGKQEVHAPAMPTRVVDATGAGDIFAAGFLYGLIGNHDLLTCGRMGCIAAAEVISHLGARAESDLHKLFREAGLDL